MKARFQKALFLALILVSTTTLADIVYVPKAQTLVGSNLIDLNLQVGEYKSDLLERFSHDRRSLIDREVTTWYSDISWCADLKIGETSITETYLNGEKRFTAIVEYGYNGCV